MKNRKFEEFVKTNSEHIYNDGIALRKSNRDRLEQRLNLQDKSRLQLSSRVKRISYWLVASVILIVGVLLSQMQSQPIEDATNLNNAYLLSYITEVNNKIDSIIVKVEQINDSNHDSLIADLKELKADNNYVIRSSYGINEDLLRMTVFTIKEQQVGFLTKIESLVISLN